MKKIFSYLFAAIFVFFTAAPLAAVAMPQNVAAGPSCESTILGIPPWYRGLTNDECAITSPSDSGDLSGFIWRIVLNIIQIALVLIAYISGFFILYGGFLYMTSNGNPSQVEKAKKSIFNAVIGLVISLASVAITNFIFDIVGSAPSTSGEVPRLSGEQLLQNGLNMVYFIAGLVSVIMIIFGGIKYTTSAGNPSAVTSAKNTLTYSIVGLIIVLVAFAITSFVIGRFS